MKSWIYFPNYAWTNIIIVVATKGRAFIVYLHPTPTRESSFQEVTSNFPFALSNSRTKKRFASYKRVPDEDARIEAISDSGTT